MSGAVLGSLRLSEALLVYGPLLLVGGLAGAVRALSQRPGLPDRRRRGLQAAWVLLLLAGVPLWLFLAAAIAPRR